MKFAPALTLLLAGCASAPAGASPDPATFEQAIAEHTQLEARVLERIAQTDSAVRAAGGEPIMVGLSLVDLETGRRFGVNEDVSMHAASTMKVPVLLELFRQEEAGLLSLDDSIVVRNEFHSILDGSPYSLSPEDDSDSALYALVGQQVTIRELAQRMIARSSNLATNILIDVVDAENVRRTMARLNAQGMEVLRGVEDIPAYEAGLSNRTTSYAYSRVLESIARCSLLSQESCDEMIAILASQQFREKIPAGLPPGTRVANKTGWITGINHDGAIVFPAGRESYVLVVLTRGIMDVPRATALISDLSRIVWQEIVARDGAGDARAGGS